jgi:hypothetical protein
MRLRRLVCLLVAASAYAQTVPSATVPAATAQPSAAEIKVGPNDPVITINGFCAHPAGPENACKTVITRAQFEKLTDALQPGMSLSLRRNVATEYARNMRMGAAAEKRGLDKTPAFEEEMRYARMQLLSQDLYRVLQTEANNISDADLEDYYKKNQNSYEQATLSRIFVPRKKQIAPADAQSPAQEKSAEEAMTKLAADLRTRAANGEDPDKLQIEAYSAAGFPRTTADTKMEKVRRATLPPRHESVMDLKPGEVSQVFSDPSGADFIYKMISKQTLTLEDVTPEIRAAISTQRYRDSLQPFQADVVFSDAYFNPPGTSAAPPPQTRKPHKKHPLEQPAEDHN